MELMNWTRIIIKNDAIPKLFLFFAHTFTVNIMAHGTPMGGSAVPYHRTNVCQEDTDGNNRNVVINRFGIRSYEG